MSGWIYNSETLSRLKNRHYVVFVTTLSPFRKTSSSDARRTRDLRNCFVLETWKTHHETSTANSTGETSKQSNLLPYLMACELRIIRASRSNGSWLGVINDLTWYKISCWNLNHLVLSERFYSTWTNDLVMIYCAENRKLRFQEKRILYTSQIPSNL